MKTKRLLLIVLLCIIGLGPAQAVLKEKNLAQTLNVLLAELKNESQKQKMFIQRYQSQSTAQHQTLVNNLKKCEQIGLMLYSQKTDYTFDMAYACQEATKLHENLQSQNRLPYDQIKSRIQLEIERYNLLIETLKKMPPKYKEKKGSENTVVQTKEDSILTEKMDSLDKAIDSLGAQPAPPAISAMGNANPDDEDDMSNEPYYLNNAQIAERKQCVELAESIRDGLSSLLTQLDSDNAYYTALQQKADELYKFAQSRYAIIQQNIFVNGGKNYFSILANLPQYLMLAFNDADSKYKPLGPGRDFSEWRGWNVVFISIFTILYLAISLIVSYVVLRWLLPKKWRGKDFKLKRQMLNNVVGIALFGIIVICLRQFMPERSLVLMGTGLMINMTWILEAIFLSLYIRLKGAEMTHAALIYTPLMALSFVVILFRIVLIPNNIVNLIFPPILLFITIWQIYMTNKHKAGLPQSDTGLVYVSTMAMGIACIASWVGFTLLAVEIILWWTFQLAAILSVICIYDLLDIFEEKYLIGRLNPAIRKAREEGKDVTEETLQIIRRMKKGDYISRTWLYDLFHKTILPIAAVGSVLLSLYWAAQIFEMGSLCKEWFFFYFINEEGVIRLSAAGIVSVIGMWFVFRYINYLIRSIVKVTRKANLEEGETYNSTLAKNVISILVWGSYFIFVLVFLRVPRSGISVIMAGLSTGLGFASKDLLENFVYGLSLMTGRVHVGDYIECDGIRGKVESISYQSTQVVTLDGSVIAFLNSALFTKNFKNLTRNHRYELIKIPVGIAYGSNVQQVRKMLLEALEPLCGELSSTGQPLTSPDFKPGVVFSGFGDNSVDLLFCVWVQVEDHASFTARAREIIYDTLNANNVEIPFPQRDLYIKEMPKQ